MSAWTRASTVALALVALPAGPAIGQQRTGTQECRLNYRSNFRLNGAQQHLTAADAASFAPDKLRRASDAWRVLTEAARAGGVEQITLWMFMGRAYALLGDLEGADTAWTRAEAVADDACNAEITRRRRNEFVPFNNAAVTAAQEQRYDSALASFRRGLAIYRADPAVYITMGSIYLQQENEDSAVALFRRAAHVGTDPRTLEARLTALFNAARLLQRSRKWAQADSVFREYLVLRPGDAEARAALAGVLANMGRTAEATAMYDSILASADSLSSFDLFDTGVALFRQAQSDTLPADSMRRRELFGKAARAFDLGLAKNPHLRDALYNLTNTYLATNDTARGLDAAKRLVAEDPLNSQSLRLLAAAYQRYSQVFDAMYRRAAAARDTATARRVRPLLAAYQDSTVRVLARSESLAVEVQISRFDPRDSTASLRGVVMNRQPQEQPASQLVLEFLNQAGEVVAREVVEVPAMSPLGGAGGMYDFNITANGRGIISYRYRRG
jgi:tetratricopeptide (TPR) repeat protein